MSSADEPMDDWDRGEQAAQGAFIRGALRTVLPALIMVTIGISVRYVTWVLGILGVATLPRPWIAVAVFYLIPLIAMEVSILTKARQRYDPDSPSPSATMRWRRLILSRIATVPLAYLAFRALDNVNPSLFAAISAGLLWIAPILLALFRSESLDRQLRALQAFLRGGDRNGPEV